jgi:ABC-2 type transport system permease protein
MTVTGKLETVKERGWRLGYLNLLHRESQEWWGTRRWLMQSVLWIIMIDGFMAFMLFVMPAIMQMAAGEEAASFDVIEGAVAVLFQLGMIGTGVGTIILGQDLILEERLNGISEWILSKPVSRVAYILAKLVANMVGISIFYVGIPAGIGYALLAAKMGNLPVISPFMIGVGAMLLHSFFYFTLTLMMGILSQSRSIVLSVTMGTLFAGLILPGFMGKTLASLTPWMLPRLMSGIIPVPILSMKVLTTPLIMTAIWSIAFISFSLFQFRRLEF